MSAEKRKEDLVVESEPCSSLGDEIKNCTVREAIDELRSIKASWDNDALLKYNDEDS